ncbi:alpha/beta hydrolase [Prauserella sp. PE36]|uniref:alpha/beta hydrolase n=1 Tax=Prauserella sp. PE36 TaxID=1504709 RepID=UPI000DE24FFD|nr:alpha/beta hydrolase [Prauserella sp. PE36]RBM11654.1 alpha/beta hydrolase [Prauserella sp. PE36]
MPRRGRARRLTVAALAGGLILAGCTAGPSTRPAVVENDGPAPSGQPTTPRQVPLPGLEEPGASDIAWADCGPETRARLGDRQVPGTLDFSCARITTTLDAPDLPRRGITRMALLKVGTGPIPLAVVNDVDGEPGTLYAARLAARLPEALLRKFHLIGIDRRGTGDSDAVRCIPSEVRATLLGHDPERGVEPALDAARTAGQQCAINLEEEQGALDSWRAAGDLDELRQQLGLDRLSALGHGEGSKVVAIYGARYPDRVGRVVLDGVPDPSADLAAVLDGVAGGAEATLDAFAEDCASRGCPLGADARAAVTSLADQLAGAPLVTDSGVTLGRALSLRAVLTGLAERERWPELADAIAAARGGNGGPLTAFVEPYLLDSDVAAARLDGALATRCNDTSTRLPADQLTRVTGELGTKHPVFGALVAQELTWCSPWPSRREALPEIGGDGAPPMVVVSTATDPVTPEQGTIRAAEQIPSAVRIAWQGAGHGALGSPCVAEAVRAFLADGKVPRDGTLCPA